MAVGSSESLCKVPLRNRFLWTTYQNSSLAPIFSTNHDYDIGSQLTPNKPNHQMPATTPAHENMNAANVDLGNLMRQRRSRKPDAALSAQMQLRCGSDAAQMRRCFAYHARFCLFAWRCVALQSTRAKLQQVLGLLARTG
jgi:hypothetical protein